MVMSNLGVLSSGLKQDKEGHRDYTINWLMESNDVNDGPQQAINGPDLAVIGSPWVYGNDNDPWAFCWPDGKVREVPGRVRGEWSGLWVVQQHFSTRPLSRCQTTAIDDPLAEPARLKGVFNRYTREAVRDRNGDLLLSSSKEPIRGLMLDDSNATVMISANVASLPLSSATSLRGHVNDAPMWGLDSRSVKLVEFTWERKLFGTCTYYYTVTYGFDINFERYIIPIIDQGTRYLKDTGDPNNIDHWIPARHKTTNEKMTVWLDGAGGRLTDLSNPVIKDIELEPESNFFTLGIPASL